MAAMLLVELSRGIGSEEASRGVVTTALVRWIEFLDVLYWAAGWMDNLSIRNHGMAAPQGEQRLMTELGGISISIGRIGQAGDF